MKNKYVNRSKVSEAKFRDLVRYFSLDLTATQIAQLTGLNRNTVNRYLAEIRIKIASYTERTAPLAFPHNPTRIPSRETDVVILVYCIEMKVMTSILSVIRGNNWKEMVVDIAENTTHLGLAIHTESGHLYEHTIGKTDDRESEIREAKRFWNTVRSRLSKFKGIHTTTCLYHLKECEFRYNHSQEELYSLILQILRKDPLF
ncbi:MAG: hypothetical protein WEA36_10120 [Balneolaceae bacterium]